MKKKKSEEKRDSHEQKPKKSENDSRLIKLEEELKAEKEARLRLLADFQNYRKRTEEEKNRNAEAANKRYLQALTEIIADYQRVQISEETAAEKQKGLELVFNKLKSLLSEFGLEEIVIKPGQKFNPDIMEAITTVTTDDEQKNNTVVHVSNNAYKFRGSGHLFQSAKVITAKFKSNS